MAHWHGTTGSGSYRHAHDGAEDTHAHPGAQPGRDEYEDVHEGVHALLNPLPLLSIDALEALWSVTNDEEVKS